MYIFNEVIQEFVKKNQVKINKLTARYLPYAKPPVVLVFEDDKRWGYFSRSENVIAFNKRLIFDGMSSFVDHVLKHEFAHFLVYRVYGDVEKSHGKEFKKVCEQLGIDPSAKASLNEMKSNNVLDNSDKVLEKIKKLFRLASSSNENESESALLKANELLLKHNLSLKDSQEVEEIYMKNILYFKRKNEKVHVISSILKTFGVYLVTSSVIQNKKKVRVLQASGSKSGVEIATYISSFLDEELDRMWKKIKQENGYKGLVAKNSFFRGVASGYISKQENIINKTNIDLKKELVVVQKNNEELARKMIYKSLTFPKRKGIRRNLSAESTGSDLGRKLSFNKVVKTESNEIKKIK